MNDNASLDGFLSELTASLSQDSREAMVRRVNAERLMNILAKQLVDQHEAESIRILPDRRLAGEISADFLVQVDDYDLRLVLLDIPEEKPSVSLDQLQGWVNLLEANNSTDLIIAVWTDDELTSLPFSMAQLHSAIKSTEQLQQMLGEARPLNQVISDVIRHQVKIWDVAKDLADKPSTQSRDIYSIFAEKINLSIDTEVNRRYRIDERLRAARNYPSDQEKKVILSVLQEALSGGSAKELHKRLTSLPHLGEQ